MNISLRWYQEEAVQVALEKIRPGFSGVISLPTGSGKSIVIGKIIYEALKKYDGKILNVIHTRELVRQNQQAFSRVFGTPSGVYSAGLNRKDIKYPVVFAGIGSIYRKSHIFGKVAGIIVDECHTINARNSKSQYMRLISDVRQSNPDAWIIGLTATPWRLGHGPIFGGPEDLFEEEIYSSCTDEAFCRMVEDGYLSPLISRASKNRIDTSKIKTTSGEFDNDESIRSVDSVIASLMPEIIERTEGRNSIMVFVPGVSNIDNVGRILSERGQSWSMVHGGMSAGERDRHLIDFKSGATRWMINCKVLTTGFDHPGVDCIVLLLPTKSSALHVQILGRGTRVSEGKTDCLIIDCVGNTVRNGAINDPVIPPRKGKSANGGKAPAKECPDCGNIDHASARECSNCGHEYPPPDEAKNFSGEDPTAKPMIVVNTIKANTNKIALFSPGTRSATVVIDKHGRHHCRVDYGNKMSRLISSQSVADAVGIKASSGPESWANWVKMNGLPMAISFWRISSSGYISPVSGKPTPADAYWCANISNEGRDRFIDAVLSPKIAAPSNFVREAHRYGIKGVSGKVLMLQAKALRLAFKKHGVELTMENVSKYLSDIYGDEYKSMGGSSQQ